MRRSRSKDGKGGTDMDEQLLELTELQQVLEDYAKEAEEMYKYQIALGRKNASRKLTDTIKSNVVVGDQSYEVTLTLQHYWKYIEHGRPAGKKFPPMKVLLDWISVKPVIPRPDEDGNIPSPQTLAFLIGRKIHLEGIEPHPALKATQEELDMIYHDRLSAALGHDVANYIRKLIAPK
jgi:hypothetical protein